MKHIIGLIRHLFQYLELLISFITPRNKNQWCFGSSFSGNAKFLFLYMCENVDKRCVWIGEDKDVKRVRDLGYEAYANNTLKGHLFLLRGGVYVYNSYIGNVGLYTWGRVKKVNLWHGVGLKNIEYNIKVGPIGERYHSRGLVNKLRYMNFRVKPDLLLTTSPMMTSHFTDCFQINEKYIIESIYPRCVPLLKGSNYSYEFIKRYESEECMKLVERIKSFSYSYIYMPTFRDSGRNFMKEEGVDFDEINESLKKNNRLLILKLHPDTKINLSCDYSNIILMGNTYDLYPVLPFTDCLITDYSSIYFDYILMEGKDVILFIPDFEDYINNSRDLAFSYQEYTKGIVAKNYSELLNLFEQNTKTYEMPNISGIRSLFWSSERMEMGDLVQAIEAKLN